MVLDLIGGPRGFVAFTNNTLPIWDPVEEELEGLRHDSRVVEVLTEHGVASPVKIKALPKPERDGLLRDLRARGFSIRELERLTGIGRGVIQRS